MPTLTEADDNVSPDPVSWVDLHADALFGFAMSRVRDRTVAEDLVQETLLAAIQALASRARIANERSWLIGILRHKVIDHFRRGSRDQRPWDNEAVVGERYDDEFDDDGHWSPGPIKWDSPESALEQTEFLRALDLCLDALPVNLRSAFCLRELDGATSDELAETLGTTKNNIWVLLSRARQRLRHCLDRHWFNA